MNCLLDNEIKKICEIKYNETEKSILVLSDDAVHIQCGYLEKLHINNKLNNITTIIASSYGCIISYLFSSGKSPKEIHKLLCDNTLINIINNIDSKLTFKELYKKKKINIIFTTMCMNDRNVVYLSNQTFPDMKISNALNMAVNHIPYLYQHKYYIDASYIEPFPIKLFKDKYNEIIGVYINKINSFYNKEKTNLHNILYYLSDILYNNHNDFIKYIIIMNCDKAVNDNNESQFKFGYEFDIMSL